MYQPKIHDTSIRRLYQVAKKLQMPMTKLINLIVAAALEELEPLEVDDAICCVPVRPEEPQQEPRWRRPALARSSLVEDCARALKALLASPDLNLDTLESATIEAIGQAHTVLTTVNATLGKPKPNGSRRR